MNYTEYVDTIRRMAETGQDGENPDFEFIVPRMIEYAELRIYRDLDLLTARGTETATCTSGQRTVTVPTSILIVDAVNVVTPAGTAPDAGTRVPLDRVSLDFINAYWPVAATTGTPAKFALQSDTVAVFAPTPSGAFKAEFIGITRPTLLSATQTETFISTKLPDLLIAASMVWITGYQKNYGAQVNDPQAAGSWETQYKALLDGCNKEELRRWFGQQAA